MKKLNYEKANRQLQDKQCELLNKMPAKYQTYAQQACNAEYILAMLEEGHDAETYENEIFSILNTK